MKCFPSQKVVKGVLKCGIMDDYTPYMMNKLAGLGVGWPPACFAPSQQASASIAQIETMTIPFPR